MARLGFLLLPLLGLLAPPRAGAQPLSYAGTTDPGDALELAVAQVEPTEGPWWEVEGARPTAGGGATAQLGFFDGQLVTGGRAFFGVVVHQHALLEIGLSVLSTLDDARLARLDLMPFAGLRVAFNPRDRFRVYLPLSVGVAFHRARGPDGQQSWGTHLSGRAGLGVEVHVFGPLLVHAAALADVRRRVDLEETRALPLVELGASLLF
ncbi:MAG TPA: hypothetical protein DEF51_26775 [Myxococcales bacterium]|nr:hypothetical protein [Myxococcales bacterium]